MRGLQTEYVLKGTYLGLLVYLAQQQARTAATDWMPLGWLAVFTFGGLALALLVAAVGKLKAGFRVRGRVLPFILFLLLEAPMLVYAGIILGTLGAIMFLREPGFEQDPWFFYLVGGGAALGVLFGLMREVKKSLIRLGVALVVAAGLVAVAVWFVPQNLTFSEEQKELLSGFLLLGIPVFYLLTFVGRQEESEAEIAATCGLLVLALAPLLQGTQFKTIPFLLPALLYFWYVIRVMKKIRVFKHTLRGISHAQVGRHRHALLALGRALQLEPGSELAREWYWRVHVGLDLEQLSKDPALLELVDFNLCVERAGSLLLEKPNEKKMAEAERLLDLVLSQRPGMNPQIKYWRAVAACHTKKTDIAIELLNDVLDTEKNNPQDTSRNAILLQAWQLCLMSLEDLRRQVGLPQLEKPGRRMEAIAAVERHWAECPDDPNVWPLRRLLYQDLSEEEFQAALSEGRSPAHFDYGYARELGMVLIEDQARWQRGLEYLRMATAGSPETAPSCFVQIAEVYQREGAHDEAWQTYEQAVQAGLAYEPQNLSAAEKQSFYGAVKLLGERALNQNDLDAALAKFKIYSQWDRSGIETWRTLAEIFERREDALAALRANEHALTYNGKDKDLLERKDRYYISVSPEQVQANLETMKREMDVEYCLRKSRSLLEFQDLDPETLDWVLHLISLALVIHPESCSAKVIQARVHWRRGEIQEAAQILESVRTPKPEKFESRDDEDAWYSSCQLLGDLYLNNLGDPQKAIECLSDFRKSPKSGARTQFRLGQAYEQIGDTQRAVKCYQNVTAYTGNPLAPDAEDALHRLGAPTN